MRLPGQPSADQVVDEVVREVWARLHPGRPVPERTPFGTEPEFQALRNQVRETVYAMYEDRPAPAPPEGLREWERVQRDIVLAAKAYLAGPR